MRVFTIAVLPSHPTKIPFLTNNVTVQGGEDLPLQNRPQVLPIPKGQGGQVRFIARLHLCRSPRGIHLGKSFVFMPLPPLLPPSLILGAPPPADRLPATRSSR